MLRLASFAGVLALAGCGPEPGDPAADGTGTTTGGGTTGGPPTGSATSSTATGTSTTATTTTTTDDDGADDDGMVHECQSYLDCPAGQACLWSFPDGELCVDAECIDDEDCRPGFTCYHGNIHSDGGVCEAEREPSTSGDSSGSSDDGGSGSSGSSGG